MEHRLNQSQAQKLILSPQIRQYLRLLQLPLAELGATVEQELEENPALEEVPSDAPGETDADTPSETPTKETADVDELRFDQTLRSLDKIDESLNDGFYSGDDLSLPEIDEAGRQRNYQESLITRRESLADYLLWQLGFLDLVPKDREVAEEILGNLTEDGYLGVPLEEIANRSAVSSADAEKVLREVQTLDPPGIAARNLQETLLIQLERTHPDAQGARRIVQDLLPLLIKKQWDLIAKRLKATPEEIQKAAQVIAHLDPKPGRTFYGEAPIAVKPDASVSYDDSNEGGKLRVEIHDEEIPEIRVSPYYRRMLRNPKLDPNTRKFLKEKLQAALDFVRALGQRRSTLREITEEIVAAQTEFFERGFSQLKPLRLKDIAGRLGIHESTVSRALQGKYVTTPQGTIPYKSFFSSRLERIEGGVESQKSAMEKIREMIQSEDPRHPLSDDAITRRLQQEGLKIARRTVAKYRELLKILPSHLRKKSS